MNRMDWRGKRLSLTTNIRQPRVYAQPRGKEFMKLTNTRRLILMAVLATTINFAASMTSSAQDRKKQSDDEQTTEEAEKGKKHRRSQEQNPNVTPDSIQPRRRQPVQQAPPREQPGMERRRQGEGAKKQQAPADSENVSKKPATPEPPLQTRPTRKGIEKTTPSGVVRERVEKRRDGEHIENFAPTGHKQREVIAKPDGTVEKKFYNLGGKVSRDELVRSDGARQVTNHQLGR